MTSRGAAHSLRSERMRTNAQSKSPRGGVTASEVRGGWEGGEGGEGGEGEEGGSDADDAMSVA